MLSRKLFPRATSFNLLILLIISVLVVLTFLLNYLAYSVLLSKYSEQFKADFSRVAIKDLANDDSSSLAYSINAVSESIKSKCLIVSHNGNILLEKKYSSCTADFRTRKIEIYSPDRTTDISIYIQLPSEIENLLFAMVLVQVIIFSLCFFVGVWSKKTQMRQVQHFNDLAVRVAHDLKSPISALSALIGSDVFDKDEGKKLLQRAAERIGNVSADLVENAKQMYEMSAGKRQGDKIIPLKSNRKFSTVDLNKEIADLIDEKRLEYKDQLFEIEFISNRKNHLLKTSSADLMRAISNIINNSFDAKKVDKKLNIRIDLITDFENCLIRISDNGTGISSEVLAKLGKIKVSTKSGNRGKGSGTGLFSAYSTIAGLGGRLSVNSKINVGTVVEIRLGVI